VACENTNVDPRVAAGASESERETKMERIFNGQFGLRVPKDAGALTVHPTASTLRPWNVSRGRLGKRRKHILFHDSDMFFHAAGTKHLFVFRFVRSVPFAFPASSFSFLIIASSSSRRIHIVAEVAPPDFLVYALKSRRRCRLRCCRVRSENGEQSSSSSTEPCPAVAGQRDGAAERDQQVRRLSGRHFALHRAEPKRRGQGTFFSKRSSPADVNVMSCP